MTANDKQIDLLLRRYVPRATQGFATDHLDADELSAFAEGSLPPAARAGYVSHLVDCDQCRKQVAQLGVSAGVLRPEPATVPVKEGKSFWGVLAGFFTLPALRFGALAALVLIVGGVALFVSRRSNDSPLVASIEPQAERTSALKPSENKDQTAETFGAQAPPTSTGSQPPVRGVEDAKRDETTLAKALPTLAPPAPAAPVTTDIAPKKAGDVDTARLNQTYSPAPPGEIQTKGGEKQNVAGVSGPRQQQQKVDSFDKLAAQQQQRERDAGKDAERYDESARKSATGILRTQPGAAGRAADEKAQGPMRNMENMANNRAANENRAEPAKAKREASEDRPATEEEQTRSVGGRKFRRQGNGWVDQKFTSSMALKSVSRGSEEFEKLDGGLRSIAQQLSGQIIVVWKGKAYLIR